MRCEGIFCRISHWIITGIIICDIVPVFTREFEIPQACDQNMTCFLLCNPTPLVTNESRDACWVNRAPEINYIVLTYQVDMTSLLTGPMFSVCYAPSFNGLDSAITKDTPQVIWDSNLSFIGTAMATITKAFSWHRIVIFTDSNEEHQHITWSFLWALRHTNVTFTIHDISELNHKKMLKNIVVSAVSESHPCIVIASSDWAAHVFEVVKLNNIRHYQHKWLLYTSGDIISLLQHIFPYDNIAVIHKSNVTEESMTKTAEQAGHELVNNLDKVSCVKCDDFIEEPEVLVKLLTCGHDQNYTSIVLNYPQKAELQNLSTQLFQVYTADTVNRTDVLWTSVGTVHSFLDSTSNHSVVTEIYQPSKYGLNQRMLKIGTWEHAFFQRRVFQDNGTYFWEGLTFTILDVIAQELNFSYYLVAPSDGEWGIKHDNGSWSGLMGLVVNEEVDFAAGGFSITAEREMEVDFASPYYHDSCVTTFKKPEEDRTLLFMKPFKWEVWFCLFLIACCLGPLLWVLTIKSPVYDCYPKHKQASKDLFKLDITLLCVFKAFFTQGNKHTPFNQAGRFLVGFMWFAVVVIVGTYTGNLISGFTVTTISMPFNTLQEMVSQNEYTWGSVAGVALTMLFRDSTFEPYKTVNEGNQVVPSYEVGLQQVEEGDFAFLTDKSWYLEKSSSNCDLVMMKEEFFPTSYAWAFPSGSPLRDIVSSKIDKLTESGLIVKWISDWIPKNTSCSNGPITESRRITTADLIGLLYIWLAGIGCSLLCFLAEILHVRFMHKYTIQVFTERHLK